MEEAHLHHCNSRYEFQSISFENQEINLETISNLEVRRVC